MEVPEDQLPNSYYVYILTLWIKTTNIIWFLYHSEYPNGNWEAVSPSFLGFKLASIPTLCYFFIKVMGHNYWQYTQDNALKMVEEISF